MRFEKPSSEKSSEKLKELKVTEVELTVFLWDAWQVGREGALAEHNQQMVGTLQRCSSTRGPYRAIPICGIDWHAHHQGAT